MIWRESLVAELVKDISKRGWMRGDLGGEIGVVLAAILAGLAAYYFLKPRFSNNQLRWQWLGQGVIRLIFPVTALLTNKIGLALLGLVFPGSVFRVIGVADVLLLAMLNISVLAYILRHVFNEAPWLVRWERRIAEVIWVAYVLHVIGVLPEVANFLDSIAFHLGKQRISVLLVLQGIVSVAATVLVAMWLSRLVERWLMGAKMLDSSLRVMLTKIVQTLLVVAAVLVTLPLVGIDPTILSVFGGALGVGLGLGLQKIASNYVSGFIILLDRSIRMGDLIEIGDRQGIISRLTSRYIVLKSLDGTEALVPNDTIITSTVINKSYTDKPIWVKQSFSVGYESDLDLVLKILVEAAEGVERVAKIPKPYPYLDGFADSAVNVSVGFWLKDPENGQGALKSEINMRVWRAFREHGINIPFNRLDVVHFEPSYKLAGDGNLQGCSPAPSSEDALNTSLLKNNT